MEPKKVEELPELIQEDFPAFPTEEGDQLPEDRLLLLAASPWRKSEIEVAVSAIITVCIRAGKWQPVSAKTLWEVLQGYSMFKILPGHCINGLGMIMGFNEFEVLECREEQFIIPNPAFVEKAFKSRIMSEEDSRRKGAATSV